ncbi:DoxX family membrane protein [Microbacterium sp. No. 7]|uniref:DoxX family membrane protein n=1 Tax=Microbacterium sp. No. 7 TaxID=1714373 RepID=UPI0006D22D18|nr:DoxX family membrane protein [Microbacterium sp. No. 7]ALJ21929.1 hypothetical protein AOA12_19315 [Microbacterium sp. No. 7]
MTGHVQTAVSDAAVDEPRAASPAAITPATGVVVGLLRILLGWTLFWAGIDKVFGLGFSTAADGAVTGGASATKGFLTYGLDTSAWIAPVLQPLAGNIVIDALYLLVTVGAGLCLMLGVAVRPAAAGGALFFVLLWLAAFPLEYNPVSDQHLFWALSCVLMIVIDAGAHLGLGKVWARTPLVERVPALR